ncbi:hypothetical protein B0E41_15700 [Hydrogenophaga sp. A37]|nr:hypothetical protein B0E41_15700 [Hydrogenophaga sp. A37]
MHHLNDFYWINRFFEDQPSTVRCPQCGEQIAGENIPMIHAKHDLDPWIECPDARRCFDLLPTSHLRNADEYQGVGVRCLKSLLHQRKARLPFVGTL